MLVSKRPELMYHLLRLFSAATGQSLPYKFAER